MLRTGHTLATLLAQPPGPTDLDVAVAARAAVLDHVVHVLGDVVPRTHVRHAARAGGPVSVAHVERDPLDGLARILHARRRPELHRSPSELLAVGREVDPSVSAWAEAGRAAVLAQDAWDRYLPRPFDGARSRQIVAEVVALAEAVAVLDVALLAQAEHRKDVAAMLGSTAGMRLAAREVSTLVSVHHPAPPEAQRSAPGAEVVAALNARSPRPPRLSRELGALTNLLASANKLSPHQVRAAARVARDLTVLAARDAVDGSGKPLRDELGVMARALHSVVRTGRGEFALDPAPNKVLELALRDLHASNKLAMARGTGLGSDEAGRVARRLPGLVAALSARATAQIDERGWVVPDRAKVAQFRYAFATTAGGLHCPPIVAGLIECKAAATKLQGRVADPLVPSGLAAAFAALPSLQRVGSAQVSADALLRSTELRRPNRRAHVEAPGRDD